MGKWLVVFLLGFGYTNAFANSCAKLFADIDYRKQSRKYKTLEEFSAIPERERLSLYEYLLDTTYVKPSHYKNLIFLEITSKSKAIDRGLKKKLLEVEKWFRDNVDVEVENYSDNVVLIGEPQISFNAVVIKNTGRVLGISISVRQEGGAIRDENFIEEIPTYYRTKAEARKAGIDTEADVSWYAGGIFDFSTKKQVVLHSDDYMEWTGW